MTIIKSKNGRIITYESKKKYKEEEILHNFYANERFDFDY